ncbi:Hypothetical protein R9X50_00405800 [Acrodontium crateriforme]|uniref:DUF7492 domain-containing protein n=1 Tax=Acrodontium crateriforme TaxID=150365 RepID=A0AAQ3M5D5_9PEZI|nr:Hypothetical protein R9X50_00405800 [Acrodontium crateriforme]
MMTYLLPKNWQYPDAILPVSDTICSPSQDTTTNQTAGSPRLKVAKGSTVALQYNENGHITKPQNNAPGKETPGKVYVYGTTQSQPSDSFLKIHKQWTEDGSGGDGRGRLLYSGPFDDGHCYQYSSHDPGEFSSIEEARESQWPPPGSADPAQGMNLWCRADVTLPNDINTDLYTLYWVWDFPSYADDRLRYQPQYYTTCIDLDIE